MVVSAAPRTGLGANSSFFSTPKWGCFYSFTGFPRTCHGLPRSPTCRRPRPTPHRGPRRTHHTSQSKSYSQQPSIFFSFIIKRRRPARFKHLALLHHARQHCCHRLHPKQYHGYCRLRADLEAALPALLRVDTLGFHHSRTCTEPAA